MKITLRVDGQDITISAKELEVILQEHLSQFSKVPTEGKWFIVDPMNIDQKLFLEKRQDSEQEKLRLKIIKVFEILKENPKRYGRKFKTMKPRRTKELRTKEDFEKFAKTIGDHIEDYEEHLLECAQRISNGEEWERLCNIPDTSDWHKMIITHPSGSYNFSGGSTKSRCYYAEASVFGGEYYFLYYSVPGVVAYID